MGIYRRAVPIQVVPVLVEELPAHEGGEHGAGS